MAMDQSSDGFSNQLRRTAGASSFLNLFNICLSRKDVVERRVKLSAVSASQFDLLGVCEVKCGQLSLDIR